MNDLYRDRQNRQGDPTRGRRHRDSANLPKIRCAIAEAKASDHELRGVLPLPLALVPSLGCRWPRPRVCREANVEGEPPWRGRGGRRWRA